MHVQALTDDDQLHLKYFYYICKMYRFTKQSTGKWGVPQLAHEYIKLVKRKIT